MMETHQVKSFVPCKIDIGWLSKHHIPLVEEICRLIPAYLEGFETYLHDELYNAFELVGIQSLIKNPDILRGNSYVESVDYYYDFVMRNSVYPRHLYSAEIICYLEKINDFSLSQGLLGFKIGSIIIKDTSYDTTRTTAGIREFEF